MEKIKLYDVVESQNGYKVRLLLTQLGLDYDLHEMNMMEGEHKQEYFLKLNPNGQIPAIVDGDISVWESNAIILYLAKKYTSLNLIPEEASEYGKMMEWLFFESCKLQPSLQYARFHTKFAPMFFPEMKIDQEKLEAERKKASNYLSTLDDHLASSEYLTGKYSLADISCYCQIFPAEEGGIDMSKYSNIKSWQKRIESLPNYIGMRDKVALKS